MGDDAAAAARRIVAEVLSRHAGEDGPPAPPAGDDEPTVALPSPGEPVGGDEPTDGAGAAPGPPPDPVPAGSDTDAAAIARRIVEEVVAAGPPVAETVPPDVPGSGAAEASVRGVPPEGLSAEDEQTVHIEVPDTPDSAAEIVRRIVADVHAGQQPAEAASDAGPASDRQDPPPPPFDEPHGQPPSPHDGTATSSAAVSEPVGLAAAGAAAPAAGPTVRPLEGWAEPVSLDPEPVPAPVEESASSRTLRWLLASLLGAVALAVLFPLAVAALRALVALD